MGQEPELRELRSLLQVFVGGWYIAIALEGGIGKLRELEPIPFDRLRTNGCVDDRGGGAKAELRELLHRAAQSGLRPSGLQFEGDRGGMIKSMRPSY